MACGHHQKTAALSSSPTQEANKEANTLFFSAIQFKNQEKWDQSIAAFESYTKINSTDATAYYEIARMQRERKSAAPEALINAKKAFAIDPNNKWYALELGRCYVVNNQLSEAANAYEKSHALDTQWTLPLFEMSEAYRMLNKIDKAIETLNRIEKINGKDEYLTQSKFSIYLAANQTESAARELASLALAYPKESSYTFQAADYYIEIQKSDEALALLKKNKLESSGYYQYILFQKLNQTQPGNIENLQHLQKAMESSQIDIDKRVMVLYPYLYGGAEPEVQEIIENCIHQTTLLFPKEAKAFSMQGDYFATLHKDEAAIEAYEKTLSIDPSKSNVWSALLSIYEQSYTIDPNRWVVQAQKAIELFSLSPEFYKSKCKAQYRLGDFKGMVETCDLGIDVLLTGDADMPIFYLDKIFALSVLEKKDQAAKTAQQLLQKISPVNQPIIIENLLWNSVYFDITFPGLDKYLGEKDLQFPHSLYFTHAFEIKNGKSIEEKDFDITNFYDALMAVKYFQVNNPSAACHFSQRLKDNLKWNLWIQKMHSPCP